MGSSLSDPISSLVPALNDSATMPSLGLMLKWTSFIGPNTSATFPICALLSLNIAALK